MHKVLTVEYEIARHIISVILQKGLLSKAEFEAIDEENKWHLVSRAYEVNVISI